MSNYSVLSILAFIPLSSMYLHHTCCLNITKDVVLHSGDRSKVGCYKEQYCIRTWNVRSMNPGKLDVVKKEMARVNVNILQISQLKWTGMGELTQMTIISATVGRNPSEEME